MTHQPLRDRSKQTPAKHLNTMLLALGVSLLPTAAAMGQPTEDTEAVPAMRCWRRVSTNAVVVGERFVMTVTCSIVETSEARAIPDQMLLEPATIEVLPFDVLSGQRAEDIVNGPYRFLQYQYTLRLLTENSFGEDIEIPALELTYRIERRLDEDPALIGRQLTYVLPAEPIRVLSLVPEDIVDIRDLPPATFDEVETRTFHANLLALVAALFGLMALAVTTYGLTRIFQRRTWNTHQTEKQLPLSVAARSALRELAQIHMNTSKGRWTAEQVGQALAALRITAAVAISSPITQTSVGTNSPLRVGQIRLKQGRLHPQTSAISSGLTAITLNKRLAEPQPFSVADRQTVEQLSFAVAAFTAAYYGPNHTLPQEALTQTLESSIEHTKRLPWLATRPIRYARKSIATTCDWWNQVWTR